MKGDWLNVIQFLFMIFSGEMLVPFINTLYMSLYHPSFVVVWVDYPTIYNQYKKDSFCIVCTWLFLVHANNYKPHLLGLTYSNVGHRYALIFRVPAYHAAYRYLAVNYMSLFTSGGVPERTHTLQNQLRMSTITNQGRPLRSQGTGLMT